MFTVPIVELTNFTENIFYKFSFVLDNHFYQTHRKWLSAFVFFFSKKQFYNFHTKLYQPDKVFWNYPKFLLHKFLGYRVEVNVLLSLYCVCCSVSGHQTQFCTNYTMTNNDAVSYSRYSSNIMVRVYDDMETSQELEQ